MSKVVVLGSINMDVVAHTGRHPVVGETVAGTSLDFVPGGKGANQAVAASRLAAPTELVGRVGSDVFSSMVLDFLSMEKLSGHGVRRLPNVATGTAIVVVDDAGDNTIVVLPGANHSLTVADAYDLPIERNDIVVLQFELPLEVVHAALSRARAIGARSVLNPAPAQASPPELLALADFLVVNESELAFFTGADPDAAVGPSGPAGGPSNVAGASDAAGGTSATAGGPSGPDAAGGTSDPAGASDAAGGTSNAAGGTSATAGASDAAGDPSGPSATAGASDAAGGTSDPAGGTSDPAGGPSDPAGGDTVGGTCDTAGGPDASSRRYAVSAGGDTVGDLRRLRRRPDQVVIATLGASGAVALIGDHILKVPGRVVPVVDTTGAGDCFVGALAAALCSSAEVAEAVHFANLAASVAVQRHGAGTAMPYLADIEALV